MPAQYWVRRVYSPRAHRGETSFFAVKPGAGVELVGYEDSRTRFIGEGSLVAPTGCEPFRHRKLDDQGKLWPFYRAWSTHAADDPTGEKSFVEAVGTTPKDADAAWQTWLGALHR